MSTIERYDKKSFEELVRSNFDFAESEEKMVFNGVRTTDGIDPRDTALVVRYSGVDFRFDVGWNEYELSLAVLIKFENVALPRIEHYVYFEPFIEYLTKGAERALVPYITNNMSIKQIETVVKQRQIVFRDGLPPIMQRVAKKVRSYFGQLKTVSADQVRSYHQWLKLRR